MALQLVVAGRRPLPKGKKLALELAYDEPDDDSDIDEGSLDLWEHAGDEPDFVASVAKVVGFTPASLVLIRPAGWVLSEVVADEIAHAVEGVVMCFTYEGAEIEYDSKGGHQPATTRAVLVKRVTAAFTKPQASIKRRERHVAKNAKPRAANDDDWI